MAQKDQGLNKGRSDASLSGPCTAIHSGRSPSLPKGGASCPAKDTRPHTGKDVSRRQLVAFCWAGCLVGGSYSRVPYNTPTPESNSPIGSRQGPVLVPDW